MPYSKILSLALLAFLLTSNKCSDKKTAEKESAIDSNTIQNTQNFDPMIDRYKPFENDPYAAYWTRVLEHHEAGKMKSAFQVADTIDQLATQANNELEVLRALLAKSNFITTFEENDVAVSIKSLQDRLKTAQGATKNILHLVLSHVYQEYYSNYRWMINERTTTENFDSGDFLTWDADKYEKTIDLHVRAALENAADLRKYAIHDFKAILLNFDKRPELFESLYDLVLHEVLTLQKTANFTYSDIHNEPNAAHLFVGYQEFMDMPLNSVESVVHQNVLSRYQELLRYHHAQKAWDRLVFWDLERIEYVKSMSYDVHNTAYLKGLIAIINQDLPTNETAMAFATLANILAESTEEVDFIYPLLNLKNKPKAKKICEEAMVKFEDSCAGVLRCKHLLESIEKQEFSFSLERTQPKNTTGLFKVNYRNVNKMYFRIYEIPKSISSFHVNDDPYDADNRIEDYLDDIVEKEIKPEPEFSWSENLKNYKDYETHTFTTTLPKLDYGRYILVASTDPNFNDDSNLFYREYSVSDLALAHLTEFGEGRFLVSDQITGKAISNAELKVYASYYDNNTRSYRYRVEKSLKTDKKGSANYKISDKSYNTFVHIKNGKDELLSDPLYQYRNYHNEEKTRDRMNFFTDRAIYRPGQEVFFKGICFTGKNNDFKVNTNQKGTVTLYDVNGQKVKEMNYVSNEYGSFTGAFRLPTGVLNGRFRLTDSHTKISHYFQVEEYKRPKFEVEMQPMEGEYKLNEEISVKGLAKAYSGAVVDGVKVSYTITEGYRFPRWGWYFRGYYPDLPEKQIAYGEVETDEKGAFEIKFMAKENTKYRHYMRLSQHYKIIIDVVDITGETQSTTQNVSVAKHAMELKIIALELAESSAFKSFSVEAMNLNGRPLNAKGTARIVALEDPKRLTVNKSQFAAEQYSMDSVALIQTFPHFSFENGTAELKELNEVIKFNFDTEKSKNVLLPATIKLKPGRYKIKAEAIDRFGERIESEQIFTLYDQKAKDNPLNELLFSKLISAQHEPGKNAELLLWSGAENLYTLVEAIDANGVFYNTSTDLGKKQMRLEIPITEKQRGGFYIRISTQKYGQFLSENHFVQVPFSNKELHLKFETFRNKLLPGQEESWKITIAGEKGDKFAAELLAAMYDASLDQFAINDYALNLYSTYLFRSTWSNKTQALIYSLAYLDFPNVNPWYNTKVIPALNYGYYGKDGSSFRQGRGYGNAGFATRRLDSAPMTLNGVVSESLDEVTVAHQDEFFNTTEDMEDIATALHLEDAIQSKPHAQIRTNLNETAFFLPQLQTNANGEVVLNFTMPEALTRWKFISLAHTKDMKVGTLSDFTVTQKDLMILPNAPRFLRQGDTVLFVAKVSNLSEQTMSGSAALEMLDARTMQQVNLPFQLKDNQMPFSLEKGANTTVTWQMVVPDHIESVIYRVTADAGNFVDGEENMLPILSNRILVTESLPLPSKGVGTRTFRMNKLWNSGASKTLQHERLTLEYTSNPAWYAVQAIPYLMEYPHQCAEQLFSRYYANALATHIVQSNPKIKDIFQRWEKESPETLISNLEKNQELKSLLLHETPWVVQAKNETERKKRIALLFNFSKMERELHSTMNKLNQMQRSNGGFPWFTGMPDNPYITRHIVMGAGHLDRLGIQSIKGDDKVFKMLKKAVQYMDQRFLEDYQQMLKWNKGKDLEKQQVISFSQLQYLYARSYFLELEMNKEVVVARDFYLKQMLQYKHKFSLQGRAMTALCAHRFGFEKQAKEVVAALKDIAIVHDEMGMYWKENVSGYAWYQAPIETQALLIEAFDQVAQDYASVEEMKIWLLKNKQTTDWKTTKATTQAVYAMFMRGSDLLADEDVVDIFVADRNVKLYDEDFKAEAGTGYFKKTWSAEEIQPVMGEIKVTRSKPGVSWGALYWQYFEDLDKITSAETPLKLKKQLFLVRNTPAGEAMAPINNNSKLKPGDKIRVRIELRADRDMEFVHMKDMRAAGFEPVNVISQYKYQGGIGYYESTKDASTNFFMDYLRKGVYVFEYDVRANLKGQFANGITTIQCMYAPEFSSHSEGIRVRVE